MEPKWEEENTIDLEGSENLRLLVYEQTSSGSSLLRGRAQLELSRSWLTEKMNEQVWPSFDSKYHCWMAIA